jgi:hypothetical protein
VSTLANLEQNFSRDQGHNKKPWHLLEPELYSLLSLKAWKESNFPVILHNVPAVSVDVGRLYQIHLFPLICH